MLFQKEAAATPDEVALLFEQQFLKNLKELPQEVREGLNKNLVTSMREQAKEIIPAVLPAVADYFGDHAVVSTEEKIYVPIKEFDKEEYFFKGYIDLVIKTPDDRYHIIDWKTCSWGWDARKRSDPMISYQLVFYKHYFAAKHNIDPSQIETHFALLKRTAKSNRVEIFRNTSGKKKTENAIKLLATALYNITSKKYIKNR